jgi:hypothetical protein
MIMFLTKELESLKQDEDDDDDDALANHYLEALKWLIRLGRVITTREIDTPPKKYVGKQN